MVINKQLLAGLLHTWLGKVRVALAFALLTLLMLAGLTVEAATPLAGTTIINRAEASYIAAGYSASETVFSNEVLAEVLPVEAVTLTRDQEVNSVAGAPVVLPHVLTNTGNVQSSYLLDLTNLAGDGFDMNNLQLILDSNGNGIFDANETVIALKTANAITLEPGRSVNLLVKGFVPTEATASFANIQLTATTATANSPAQLAATTNASSQLIASNIDKINITDGPVVPLVKSASQSGFVAPGTPIDYTLVATNIGNGPALPSSTHVTIDGQQVSVFLIRDLIPAHTHYVAGSLNSTLKSVGGKLLYHARGSNAFVYQTSKNYDDPNLVDEVAVAINTGYMKPNVTASMTFSVTVDDDGYAGIIPNSGTVYYNNASLPVSNDSNVVIVNTAGARIGVAKQAGRVIQNVDAAGLPDGSYTVPFTFIVKNYGDVPLYDLQLHDLLEGNTLFGNYSASVVPAQGSYTVVPGTGTALPLTGQVYVAYNNNFTGQSTAQNLLAPNAVLPVGGGFKVQFSVRINPDPARYGPTNNKQLITINNNAQAIAATQPQGQLSVNDDSVDGANPDPDNNKIPSEKSPTPIVIGENPPPPYLTVVKTVSAPREISDDTFELDYTLRVKNVTTIEDKFVRISDNLDCTFDMDQANGPVKNWTLVSPPTTENGLLTPATSTFTGYISRDANGRGICDRNKLNNPDPQAGFPTEQSLNLVDGNRSLLPGQEEVIHFTVRIVRDFTIESANKEYVNKAYAGIFDSNSINGSTIVVASASSVATLVVDPSGVVYDSVTHALISGAKVILTRGQCEGGGQSPFTTNDLSIMGNVSYAQEGPDALSMTTAADGAYFFYLKSPPVTQTCDYTIDIVPPANYKFQSAIAPVGGAKNLKAAPPGDVFVQPQEGPPQDPTTAPYYLKLHLGPLTNPVFHNHIPLDPKAVAPKGPRLVLEKTASKTTVELADFLDYTLTLTNRTGGDLTGFTIVDQLPPGFAYELGSTLVNDLRAPDPAGGRGRVLTWTDSTTVIPNEKSITLTYRVRVGVGASIGDSINLADATSGIYTSNQAIAKVQIIGGVFSDEGFIVGKVYMDCNDDHVQGNEEPGVPGVRVFLEDGTYIISDVEGKYSFYGIKPVTHVLKLDPSTLPHGAETVVLSNRNSGKGDSRFVDLKKGELHKADFAIREAGGKSCDKGPVLAEVKSRRAAIADKPSTDGEYAFRNRLDTTGKANIVPGDVRGLPASGLVGQFIGATPNAAQPLPTNGATAFNSVVPLDLNVVRPLALPELPVSTTPVVQLEQQIVNLDNSLGFVDLKDKDTLPIAQASVRVKGVLGVTFKLTVNGILIEERRVGKRSKLADKQIEAWEYVGVDFKPGENTVKLEQFDAAGNQRGEKTITLVAPDELGKLELDLPAVAIADGRTPVHMKLRLTDSKGVPVTVRTQVTLETDQGRFETKDLNNTEPGTQIFVEGGESEVVVIPPNTPSDGIIRINAGIMKKEVKIGYLPELRPLVGAGILEGILDLRSLSSGSLVGSRPKDAFEKELQNISTSSDDGKLRASARTAFFFKGTVLGKYLLTTAYDSDKETHSRLFRDIRPDEFYPIYGDSATKGFDAQSSSRMYVRVDKDKSYLLYGDYNTAGNPDVRQLTQYSRSLTGVKGHYENNRINATGFYSRQSTKQVVDEFPANGTSGPFQLSISNGYVENSEKVEIVVRDRNQPSLVLASSPQARFVDYSIDPLSQRLLFRGPVPSIDANFNRQYIRITYEVKSGFKEYGVGGVDAQIKVTDYLQLGAIGIKDTNPDNRSNLVGGTAVLKLAEKTILTGEYAHSESDLLNTGGGYNSYSSQYDGGYGAGSGYGNGTGNGSAAGNGSPQSNGKSGYSGSAVRLELRHEQGDLSGRIQYTRTDPNFYNQSAYNTAGRTEIPATLRYKLTANTAVKAEALYSKDEVHGGERKGAIVNLVTRLADGLDAEFGMRASQDKGAPGGSACVTNLTNTTGNCLSTASSTLARSINNDLLTVRSKFSAQVPWVTGLKTYIEAEQDVRDINKHLFAVGANYQLTEKTRVFGRYEFANTLGSQFALNSFAQTNVALLGIESAYTKGGNIYNEFRLRDSQSGREAQTALGVRNTWQVTEGLRLGTSFETTRAFNGLANNNATVLTGQAEYFGDQRYRASGNIELRKASTSDSLLNTLALSYKINRDWSFLGRNIFSVTDSKTGGTTIQMRQQLGLAYREVEQNVWNWLTRYEHKYESLSGSPNETTTNVASNGNGYRGDYSTDTHIVSAHVNYQASSDVILSARYAGKYLTSANAGLTSDYWAQLLYSRATWDFYKDFDASVQAAYYVGKGGATQYAAGLELGYQAVDNLWLSVGYNVSGVSDRDLTANGYLNEGPYARVRFKFDENTFSGW